MNIRRALSGRLLPGLTLIPVAALALGGLVAGTAAAQRGEIGTLADRDDFSNRQRIQIEDNGTASPYPSPITVPGLPPRLYDVNVTLNGFKHENPDDVDILLEAPNGDTAIIMSDAGGGNAVGGSGINLTLDDEAGAGNALPDTGQLQTKTYVPQNYGGGNDGFDDVGRPDGESLGVFDGDNPNGTWKLYVVDDDRNADDGEIINGWELEILYGFAPRAVDDKYDARQGRTLRVRENRGVLANDNDGDPEPGVETDLIARVKKDPRKGTLRLRPDGSFTYKPDEGERGTDSFLYTVRDGDGLTDQGKVTINITGRDRD